MPGSLTFRTLLGMLVIFVLFMNAHTTHGWGMGFEKSEPEVDESGTTEDTEESRVETDEKDLPIILWWDGLGGMTKDVIRCDSGNQCSVSYDHAMFHKQDIMVYVFYGSSFLSSGMPLPRRAGDLWALMHEESPENNDWLFSFESTMELFNYTSTFKRQSDFPTPTNMLRSTTALLSDRHLVNTSEKNRLRKEGLAPVVFISSTCYSSSQRMRYVELLQKYIDVDSYGSCLNNKKLPEKYSHLDSLSAHWTEEYLEFIAQYKFIIAIEDVICDDYITEKLWRPLQAGSVPIAMGSPRLKDFLPSEKSAILISDFDSVKDLAAFIKKLDEDDAKFDQYLAFKREGISNTQLSKEIERVTPKGVDQTFLTNLYQYQCLLCEKLHEAKVAVGRGESVPRARATRDHFGCSIPSHKLDEDGTYIPDTELQRQAHFFYTNAKVLRNFYDKGENISAVELYRHSIQIFSDAELPKDEL